MTPRGINAVRELHCPLGTGDDIYCEHCDLAWPCATIRALDEAPASTAEMLAEFHERFHQYWGHGEIADSTLRIRLHREETNELVEALEAGDLVGAAHELADVVYVAYGTAHSLGIPLDAVIDAVHRANMSKFGPDGKPIVDEGGKFLKGPYYQPPDVAAVLARDAQEQSVS